MVISGVFHSGNAPLIYRGLRFLENYRKGTEELPVKIEAGAE